MGEAPWWGRAVVSMAVVMRCVTVRRCAVDGEAPAVQPGLRWWGAAVVRCSNGGVPW